MKVSNWINNIKSVTGVTSSELTIVTLILAGFAFGSLIRLFENESNFESNKNLQIFNLLDSLAEQSKAKYIGTDEFNNPGFVDDVSDSISNDTNSATLSNLTNTSDLNPPANKSSKSDRLAGKKVNINTASKVELMKLPGIGEKTAIKVIEYRSSKPFLSLTDIKKVKGIGEKKFQAMKDFIEVK